MKIKFFILFLYIFTFASGMSFANSDSDVDILNSDIDTIIKKTNIKSITEMDYFGLLINAINQTDKDKVREYLGYVNGINKLSAEGLAPVHYAVYVADKEILEMILQTNIDVNIKSSDGLTPLDIAILDNNVDLIKLLIEYNAGVSDSIAEKMSELEFPVAYDDFFDIYDVDVEDAINTAKIINNEFDNELEDQSGVDVAE